MKVQIENKILNLEAISYAEFKIADELNSVQSIKLSLIIDGHQLEFYGAAAAALWLVLQKGAEPILLPGISEALATRQFTEG